MELWQAGLLISGTSVTWAFSSWFGGWISDNRGRRAILLPAIGFTAAMTAAMGATWSFLSMFIVRDLLGFGDGIGWSVGQATISESVDPKRRGLNQALYNAGYSFFGVGCGALIVTTLTEAFGWRWVFPIVGLVTAIVCVALFAVMREPVARADKPKVELRAALGLLRIRSVLLITVMGCATLAWLQLQVGYNALYLTRIRGFSLAEAGTVMAFWGFAGTAGQISMPFLSDYLGRRPVIVGCALASAGSLALYLTGEYGLGPTRALAVINGFFGFGLSPIVLATCVAELVPNQMRGSALGMTNFFAVIVGTAIMPVAGGIVADQFGLASSLGLAIGVQVLIGLCGCGLAETAPRVLARRGVRTELV